MSRSIRTLLLLACAGVVAALPNSARSGQPFTLALSQPKREAMEAMVAQGFAVSPAQAAAAVGAVWEQPVSPTITGFALSGARGGRSGAYYIMRVPRGQPYEGLYEVAAEDGTLALMIRGGTPVGNADAHGNLLPGTVPVAEGRAIAEAFATRMIPTFPQRRWRLTKGEDVGYYGYCWQELVGPLDAVAPWDLRVFVNWFTGDVFNYTRPTEPINCPLLPEVTLAQAKALAAPHAVLDPVAFPFVGELQIHESEFGVQFLVWELRQYPDPQDQPNTFFAVGVNGMTGEVYPPIGPLGGVPPEPRPNRKPVPPPPGPLLRVPGREQPLRGADGPFRRGGGRQLWLRVETLRALGAEVWLKGERLALRRAGKLLGPAAVGAVRRQYGWEVPLRQAAGVLGWEVRWDGKKQQAEAVRPPAQRGAAKPEATR
jgi:hypothetical protein